MSKSTIAVVLAGCGARDGSEIQEAVFALAALSQMGIAVQCLAPDRAQATTVDHTTGATVNETRNMLREAARIARGTVAPLSRAQPDEFAGVVIPGGFGVAKNLCNFASAGAGMEVDPDLARFVTAMHAAQKPQLGICIAPVILAKVLAAHRPIVTAGPDRDVGATMTEWGAVYLPCAVEDCVVDVQNRLVTTPAYMHGDATIGAVQQGIDKAVRVFAEWLESVMPRV